MPRDLATLAHLTTLAHLPACGRRHRHKECTRCLTTRSLRYFGFGHRICSRCMATAKPRIVSCIALYRRQKPA